MSAHRLTDDELRAAAARRPGYATYPEYRPGQPERLGRLPATVRPHTSDLSARRPAPLVPSDAAIKTVVPDKPSRDAMTVTLRQATFVPTEPITRRRPVTLADLPPTPVYDFQPRLITARPWWQRRWHWGVLAAGGRMEIGYAWTEAGARRRTARATRRAAR